MAFPDTPRVRYERNPLVEVVCQLTFQLPYKDAEFQAPNLEILHNRVKKNFPHFKKVPSSHIEVNARTKEVKKTEQESFEFSTEEGFSKVILRNDSVILITSDYHSWENFRGFIQTFIEDGLHPTFGARNFKRVGLRYKDIIERSKIDLANSLWTELLNPYLSCIYNRDSGLDNVIGHQSAIFLKMEEDLGYLNFTHGIVLNDSTKEPAYLLDGDFFVEDEGIDYARANEYMDKHNISARKLFRWCITEKLHIALHPKPID